MARKSNGNGHRNKRSASDEELADNWRRLASELPERTKGKPPEEHAKAQLEVAKAMRDAGVLERAEAFFIIARAVELIVEERIGKNVSPALQRISKELRGIEKDHGLSEDEAWAPEDAPPEWQALNQEYDRISDALYASALEEFGEPEMAALWRDRRDEFDALREQGRRAFFSPGKSD